MLQPVGPLPASTYWRRRLVLLAVLVLLLLVAKSCVGGGAKGTGATPQPTGSPRPSATATQTPSPRPTAVRTAPVTCRDGALTLATSSDAKQYTVGATPRLTVTVKNVSGSACTRDLGGGAVEVLVYSGADRIWSSDDCGADEGVSVQTLTAGASLETSVLWPGKRSAKGCPTDRPAAKPGTYTVRARVGTLRSTVTVFRLTS